MSTTRRRKITTAVMLVFLGLALFAMVVTGIGTDGMGGMGGLQSSAGVAARVEGRQITEVELNDAVNRAYQNARERQPDLTLPAFLAGGTFEQILRQMIGTLALVSFGEEQGLTVSPQVVDREIVSIPAFRNFAGRFDENAFRQALASQNITEAQLREDIARGLIQQQLLLPIATGVRVPDSLAQQYANLLLERRQGTIGVVPAELVAGGIAPTDAEIANFYNTQRARFTVPEQRVVRYAMVGPEQVAGAAQVSDAEIANYYRQNQAQFAGRDTRRLLQVVLPDQAAAQAFLARVRGGTSFVDAAAALGFSADDITFADQTPQSFAGETSQQVAQAAFGATQGAVVGPIASPLGVHVVRVDAITRTPAQPLTAVRDQIGTQLREQKVADALNALIGRIEDRLGNGESFEEVVRAERLNAQVTPPVTQTGATPQGGSVPAELAPVLTSAFEIDADNPEPLVEQLQPNERFVLLALDRAIPAAPPPLPQIRDQVRQALVQQRALERARAVADQIVARINGGMAPAQAFAQAGLRLPAPQAVNLQRLQLSQAGEQVPPPLRLLFSLPERRARVLEAPNGAGWFVVFHGQRTPGNAATVPQLVQTTRREFSATASEELAQQFARAVERQADVARNPEVIESVRGRLQGSTQ